MTRHDIIYFCATHVPHIFIFPILILSHLNHLCDLMPSFVVGPFTIILTITTTNIIGKNRLYLGDTSVCSVSTPISFKLKIKTKLNDPLSQRSGSGEKN